MRRAPSLPNRMRVVERSSSYVSSTPGPMGALNYALSQPRQDASRPLNARNFHKKYIVAIRVFFSLYISNYT